MQLTKCESDQLIEITRLWFARSGGLVNIKIKQIKTEREEERFNKAKELKYD